MSDNGWTRVADGQWLPVGTAISEAKRSRQTADFVDLLMQHAEKQGYPACEPTLDRIERILWPVAEQVQVSPSHEVERAGAT